MGGTGAVFYKIVKSKALAAADVGSSTIRYLSAPLLLCGLLCASPSAQALEFNLGVSAGGILAGNIPRFAVTPQVGLSWNLENNFVVSIHDSLSILPEIDGRGIGLYNQLPVTAGYQWKAVDVSLGPSFFVFWMPVCGPEWCARARGLGVGGNARANIHFFGPLWASLSASADWMQATDGVAPESVLVMILGGILIRVGRR